MKKKFFLLILLFTIGISFFLIKNQRAKESEFFILSWSTSPEIININVPVELRFRIKDKKARPIEGANFQIDFIKDQKNFPGIMATGAGNGVYNSSVKFPEEGNWTLKLNIKKSDGSELTKELHVFIAKRNRI